jgi:hypothetical protein
MLLLLPMAGSFVRPIYETYEAAVADLIKQQQPELVKRVVEVQCQNKTVFVVLTTVVGVINDYHGLARWPNVALEATPANGPGTQLLRLKFLRQVLCLRVSDTCPS